MARDLTYKTLCEILSAKCYLSEQKVNLLLQNFVLLVANELQNNSSITIKNIGKFTTEMQGGEDEWFTLPNGKMVKKYVEPFKYINYTPSQNLINVVNGENLDYLFREVNIKMDSPTHLEDLIDDNIKTRQTIKKQIKLSDDYFKEANKQIKKKKEKKAKPKQTEKYFNLQERNNEVSRPLLCLNNNVIYPSINSAATQLGLPIATLYSRLVKQKKNTLKGYKFKFYEEEKGQEQDEV